MVWAAPSARAISSRSGLASVTMICPGFFSLMTWSISSPSVPTPARTTVSPSWISPRSTAWMAQASGSTSTPASCLMSAGILWTRESGPSFMNSAQAPLQCFWKPYMSCTSHIQYWPRWQKRQRSHG